MGTKPQLGSEEVTIKVDKKDVSGKIIGLYEIDVIHVIWEVKKLSEDKNTPKVKAEKDKTFNIAYKWLDNEQKMQVTVNGKSPKDVFIETMTAIKKNDKFLNNYSVEDIRNGKLDLNLANTQAVPKTYNMQGLPYQKIEPKTRSSKQIP